MLLLAVQEGMRLLLKVISQLCKPVQDKPGKLLILIKILCNWLEMVLQWAKIPCLNKRLTLCCSEPSGPGKCSLL